MNDNILRLLADHLWQSTVFGAVAWLVAQALRKHGARVRHWIWVAASLKFLVPFSLFVLAGRAVGPVVEPAVPIALSIGFEPFSGAVELPTAVAAPAELDWTPILATAWGVGVCLVWGVWLVRWLRVRRVVLDGDPITSGEIFDKLRSLARLITSETAVEPGVFGVFRPVLLLPDRIESHLSAAQMNAIVAHEICHLRRRDNLFSAMHTVVSGLFWFHPLVWWIGTRLVDERERACDEAVLEKGGHPRDYAEGILKICELYTASPLACVAGVTGSDLRKRIEAIMEAPVLRGLGLGTKVLLGACAVIGIAGPLVIGMSRATTAALPTLPAWTASPPRLLAQAAAAPTSTAPKSAELEFEVATVRPDHTLRGTGSSLQNGTFHARGSLKFLLQIAYAERTVLLPAFLISGPGWMDSEIYNVEGKMPANSPPSNLRPMLQRLLSERFQLKLKRELQEHPVYTLVVGPNGHKLTPAADGDALKSAGRLVVIRADLQKVAGEMAAGRSGDLPTGATASCSGDMALFAEHLSRGMDRYVLDKTGLSGLFACYMSGFQWPSNDVGLPSIFTSIQEQLGLRLDADRAMLETLVVQHAEKIPLEN